MFILPQIWTFVQRDYVVSKRQCQLEYLLCFFVIPQGSLGLGVVEIERFLVVKITL